MTRYALFLRGINISGKNKLAMPQLRAAMEEMGFSSVSTYLNSGNILFSSDSADIPALRAAVETMLAERFALSVPVHIVTVDALREILANAPAWWGTDDPAQYDNLIFILTDDTPEAICDMVGAPSEGLETVAAYGKVLYWSFDRAAYQKCRWWKRTAGAGIAERLTIRTANTLKKLLKNE